MRDVARVPIKSQRQLGQVVGANREPIEILEKFLSQDGIGRYLAHHDDFEVIRSP